jgi:hypothetical protein
MPLPLYNRRPDVETFLMLYDPHYDPLSAHLQNTRIVPVWTQENVRVNTVTVDDPGHYDFFNDRGQDKISDIFYERLKRALQVATLLFKLSEPFFTKVRCAKVMPKLYRRIDSLLEVRGLRTIDELDPDYTPSKADHATVQQMWGRMARHSRLFFRNSPQSDPWEIPDCHGCSLILVARINKEMIQSASASQR